MSDAPRTVNLAHNGGLPNGNYPASDLVEYTRADLADALAAALVRIKHMPAFNRIDVLREIDAALAAWEARK